MDNVIHIQSVPRRHDGNFYLRKYFVVFLCVFVIISDLFIFYMDLRRVLPVNLNFYYDIDFLLFMVFNALMRFILMYMAMYILIGVIDKFNIVRLILSITLFAASIVLVLPVKFFFAKLMLSFYKTSMIIIFIVNLWSFFQIIIICMDNFFNISDYKLLKIFFRKIDLISDFRGNWRFGLIDFLYILCLLIIIVFIIASFVVSVIVICKSYSPLIRQYGSLFERFRFAFYEIKVCSNIMRYRLMRAGF